MEERLNSVWVCGTIVVSVMHHTWHHRTDVNMSSATADDAGDADSRNNTDNAEPSRTCKIIIVGAGMAGLSAANHLLKNNITDFVLLEGRNRVGGRIIAINIGEIPAWLFLFPLLCCN